MSASRKKLAACVLALATPMLVQAQTDGVQVLLEQGQYWQSRGDYVRAEEVWEKVLQLQPTNEQALYNLGQIALSNKDSAKAQAYLARLQKAAPASQRAKRLEQEISLSSPGRSAALEKARQVAAEGESAQALPLYQEALGGREPEGALGLEYYTNLGYASASGLQQAIQGLRRLSAAAPKDVKIQLALARHLVRNESTRTEGIRMLERLSSDASVGQEVKTSWREALKWYGSPPKVESRPLLQAYLNKYPGDEQVSAQLNAQTQLISQQRAQVQAAQKAAQPVRDPLAERAQEAIKQLDQGNIALAEAQLQGVLAERANQVDALGGLGVVRMRQGRAQEAAELLQQAYRGRPGDWRQAYATAQYTILMEQAEQALAAQDYKTADALLSKARQLRPDEPTAILAQARVAIGQKEPSKAERLYRSVLQKSPNNPQAITGLVQAYAQNNQLDKAQSFVNGLTAQQQDAAGGRAKLEGMYAVGMAKAQRARGDLASARSTLEQAMTGDPNNPWIRLELAEIYNQMGYRKEAKGLVDGLLLTDPYNADALFTSALFSSQQQNWQEALITLNKIPPSLLTQDMRNLQRDATIHTRIAYASALGKQGRVVEASAVLDELAPVVANDPGLASTVAAAYADAGDSTRALGLIRQELGRNKKPSPDVLLQYAGLLFRTQQDVEAVSVLRSLDGRQLSSQQASTLRNLHSTQAIREAEALREQGDLVAAYDVLSPVLSQNPRDEDALAALARMYAAAGDPGKALGIYQQLLHEQGESPSLYLGAALVANQVRDYQYAAQAADTAVSLAPDDVDTLTTAAGIYRVQGKTSKAQKLLKQALALQESDVRGFSANNGMQANGFTPPSSGRNNNPFVGLPGQRTASTTAQTFAAAGPTTPTAFAAPQAVAVVAPPGGRANPSVTPASGALASAHPPVAAKRPGRSAGGYANPFESPRVAASGAVAQGVYQAPLSPLQAELALIEQDRSPEVAAGAVYRSRTGSSGTSRLDDVQTPIQAQLPLGDGKAFAQVTPTFLDAGRFSMGNWIDENVEGLRELVGPDVKFGNAALDRAITDRMPTSQTGVGLAVGYELRGVKVDLGVTPLGFKTQNFTGGIAYEGPINQDGSLQLGVSASSRPVTDSLMSFAGVEHHLTGQVVGGVMASGVRLDLSKDLGDFGFYGSASWHALNGKNVQSNRRMETNLGTYVHFINEEDHVLTAGINLNYISYQKNLRHFTPGHGGYFSPQNSFSIGVPFNWSIREGDLTFKLAGNVAIEHFKEKAADAFPGFSEAEAQVLYRAMFGDQVMDKLGYLSNSGAYGGQSKTGLTYNLNLAAEYDVTPGMVLGGYVGVDKSGDYRQLLGGLYMKYFFDQKIRTNKDLPLQSYSSPYENPYGSR